MSPSACRTRKKRKAPVRKELQTQICWTITRTWIMTNVIIMTIVTTIMTIVTTIVTNMTIVTTLWLLWPQLWQSWFKIMMIPTTTWTEQSFCRSSKDVASSSREMIHVFSGKEITVARPNYNNDKCHLQLLILDTPETTRQSTNSWLNIGTSVLARIMRRARRSCLAQIRIPTRTEETINIVHGPVDTMLFDTSSVE